jgi:hypothetical protein
MALFLGEFLVAFAGSPVCFLLVLAGDIAMIDATTPTIAQPIAQIMCAVVKNWIAEKCDKTLRSPKGNNHPTLDP